MVQELGVRKRIMFHLYPSIMDIGIVTPQYPPNTRGGGEISAKLLAEQLSLRTDHSVYVHSFDGDCSETINGIPVTRHQRVPRIPEIASSIAFWELKDISPKFDILHAYNMKLHPAVGALSRKYNIPSVAHLNSYTYLNKRSLGMSLTGGERLYNDLIRPVSKIGVRKLIMQIDRLIALSDSIGEVYGKYLGTDSKINNITNMIDPELTPDSTNFRTSSPPRILYAGALNQHKGVDHLIKSINYLDREVRLRVVGGGEQLDELQSLAKECNSLSQIEFTGYVPYEQIPNQYQWADIFVHPGTWPEPLNRTLLEAMQHGLAVVVTNRGGPPEIVQDENLIVGSGDPASIAEGIEYAIENRRSVGNIHYSYVNEFHHPKKVIPQIEELYRGIS